MTGQSTGNAPTTDVWPPDAFVAWYAAYPKRKARNDALREFATMRSRGDVSFRDLMIATNRYATRERERRTKSEFIRSPANWLKGGNYLDEDLRAPATAKSSVTKPRDPKTYTDDEWRLRLAKWDGKIWPERHWGAWPGDVGCLVPASIRQEHGFGSSAGAARADAHVARPKSGSSRPADVDHSDRPATQIARTAGDRFAWLRAVAAHPALKLAGTKVAMCLASHFSVATGQCNPGIQTLMRETALSERGVQAGIESVVAAGLLDAGSRKGGRGRSTNYRLVMDLVAIGQASAEPETPHDGAGFLSNTPREKALNPARNAPKPRTMVHPNIRNKENRVAPPDATQQLLGIPDRRRSQRERAAQMDLPFALPPQTQRDWCIAITSRWTNGDSAAATAHVDGWTAAIGIGVVEGLIATADAGRHDYARRLSWVANQTTKIARLKEIAACAAPCANPPEGNGAANGAGADIVDLLTPWRRILDQLERWSGSIEAARLLATRMVAAFGSAKAAAAYVKDMARCHLSGPDQIAKIERRLAKSSAEPQAEGRVDDARQQVRRGDLCAQEDRRGPEP